MGCLYQGCQPDHKVAEWLFCETFPLQKPNPSSRPPLSDRIQPKLNVAQTSTTEGTTMAKKKDDTLLWITGGVLGLGVGLYFLLKSKDENGPGVTQTAPIAPLEPPSSFPTLDSVSVRFAEVKELWRMGYMEARPTMDELTDLAMAARKFQASQPVTANELIENMRNLYADVQQWLIDTQPPGGLA